MTRYEVERSDDRWVVIDRVTGLPLHTASDEKRTRLEAQAHADFRNGIGNMTQKHVHKHVQSIRLIWKAIVGAAR